MLKANAFPLATQLPLSSPSIVLDQVLPATNLILPNFAPLTKKV